jgi:transposase
MAAHRKYPEELRERATRMALDARKDPATRTGAFKRIGEQLGVHPEALRTWMSRAEVDQRQVNWHFPTSDARIKLRHLYPEH